MGGIFNPSAGFGGNGTSPGATTFKGDTNYNIASTDRVVATNANFTAARTWTLPTAASLAAGNTITIMDQQGGITSSNTLIVAANGADTINVGNLDNASVTFGNPGFAVTLMSDGISEWFIPSNVGFNGGIVTYLNGASGIQFDNAGTMTITNAGGAGLNIAGSPTNLINNTIFKAVQADQSKSVQTPITGFTITIGNAVSSLILTPAGTLATGTINMPAAPVDGHMMRVLSSQTVTSLTVSGNGKTLQAAPTTISANTSFAWMFDNASSTWYRLY